MEEVNRFLADAFIPAHNNLFGKAPAAIPVPSCTRRAGKPCHEPRRLVHARDHSMVAVAGPRQPFPSAQSSPCSDRPCAWHRVAPVAVVDSPLPFGSFEFALKTGLLRPRRKRLP